MEVVADLKFTYLLSDSIGIVTIVQSQSILDSSGQCTGVILIFGRKFIDHFQDLLSLEYLIVYFELIINGCMVLITCLSSVLTLNVCTRKFNIFSVH